jgi:hypothetical protein
MSQAVRDARLSFFEVVVQHQVLHGRSAIGQRVLQTRWLSMNALALGSTKVASFGRGCLLLGLDIAFRHAHEQFSMVFDARMSIQYASG